MNPEQKKIGELFTELNNRPTNLFPKTRKKLDAPREPGVYIIRQNEMVLHVGRTVRGKDGLYQRLNDHLRGSSSFVKNYLHGNCNILRNEKYTYQYLVISDDRLRALLEAYTIGALCPQHIGLGKNRDT